jgi:hypothetical protein
MVRVRDKNLSILASGVSMAGHESKIPNAIYETSEGLRG